VPGRDPPEPWINDNPEDSVTDADQRQTPKDSAQATVEGPAEAERAVVAVEDSAEGVTAAISGAAGADAAVADGETRSGVSPDGQTSMPTPAPMATPASAPAPASASPASAPDPAAEAAAPPPNAAAPAATPPADDNPFAPPPEDLPAPPPAPWGAPPQHPYGQVPPGPVQPWGTQRPRPPEQPPMWGDPHRYGPVHDPRQDPDRRYRDQRELDRQPQRRERDLPTRWALGLSVGATICTMFAIFQGLATFPAWMVGAAAGLALAIGAFVMSIRAQQAASLRGERASEATASLVSSCVTGALALILLVTSIVWFSQFRDYAKCMSSAGTQAAQEVCRKQLQDSTGMTMR